MKKTALLVVLLCGACGEEKRTPLNFTEATEQTATSVADTSTRPRSVIPNPQDTLIVPAPSSTGSVTIGLAPATSPALRGNATLKANGNSTIVSVTLESQTGGGNYEGVIHSGRCAQIGPQLTDLHPVTTDSLGKGRSASFINVPLDTLQVRPHAMVYGTGGRRQACGDI
jgi:hypothetical protein